MQHRIEAESVSKRYTLRHAAGGNLQGSIRESVAASLRQLLGRLGGAGPRDVSEAFWALRDVSFQVNEGDRMAIIGRNGAGKSTLLKILSRVTQPSEGRVKLRGRMSSLLEIGTGFHQELSGRENIYLNGAILGMRRAEISRRFDEIVAFAEIERFLDTPVKRYSSGMYMRLAFAIAAHLEPDILVVDEVLAVGDAAFQRKCLGKMQEAGQGGRTVLFVSHNLGAVKQLCNVAIVLDGGRSSPVMPCEEAIALYQSQRRGEQTEQIGSGPLRLHGMRLNGNDASADSEMFSGDPMRLSFDYSCDRPGGDLWVSLGVKALTTETGVFYSDNHLEEVRHRARAEGEVSVEFPAYPLAPGRYAVDVHVLLDEVMVLPESRIMEFTISPVPSFASQALLTSFPSQLMARSRWSFGE